MKFMKFVLKMALRVAAFILLMTFICNVKAGWSDKVLLSDVKTLTLSQGKMTTGRRSSPVPQLKCVGGTARCQYEPRVVQCYNRGTDGTDVQWECTADMDKAYRFGAIEVTCEGYNHPDDPYVLKGSCGLEYKLELTGYQKSHDHVDSGYHHYHDHPSGHKHSKWGMSDILGLIVIGGVIFVIYRTCIKGNNQGQQGAPDDTTHPSAPPPPYSEHQPPPPYGFKPETAHGTQAPPHSSTSYGFRPEYTGSASQTHATGAGATSGASNSGTGTSFLTGMATGGVLGYLFGNSGNSGRNYDHYQRSHSSGWNPCNNQQNQGSSWFGGSSWGGSSGGHSSSGFSSGGHRSSSSSSSSSTHTSSGFGGTKRR